MPVHITPAMTSMKLSAQRLPKAMDAATSANAAATQTKFRGLIATPGRAAAAARLELALM